MNAANRRLVTRLALAVVAMFGFGYLMVPLYDVFCEVTGLNGRTGRLSASEASLLEEDTARTVTVEFIASVNQNLPWEFRPQRTRMQVHPGKTYTTSYYARNTTDHEMTGQAVPSVTPAMASKYFSKTECFCFTRQTFAAGGGRDMPVQFVIDPELPPEIGTVTLAYTFFDAKPQAHAAPLGTIGAIN